VHPLSTGARLTAWRIYSARSLQRAITRVGCRPLPLGLLA